jgi:outer membrane protein assembly factor BamD (BamD/ComL family)
MPDFNSEQALVQKEDFMDGLPHGKGLVAVICLLLCGLGCSPIGAVAERQPDETLFERGIAAAEQKHFSVAILTLQTLINTYPDSKYTDKAKAVCNQIAACGDAASSPDCEIAEHWLPN